MDYKPISSFFDRVRNIISTGDIQIDLLQSIIKDSIKKEIPREKIVFKKGVLSFNNLSPVYKNEIFIILRETLLIFHPTRGKWISYLMKHVWPNDFRPDDFLLQKVKEVRKRLQHNKDALNRYKNDEAFPDLINTLIGSFLD